MWWYELLLHLDLGLFKLIDLLPNHLHFLKLAGNCARASVSKQSTYPQLAHSRIRATMEKKKKKPIVKPFKYIGWKIPIPVVDRKDQGEKKKETTTTYVGARIHQCFLTGSQTPGEAGPATLSNGSWERGPSRDACYTWRACVSLIRVRFWRGKKKRRLGASLIWRPRERVMV